MAKKKGINPIVAILMLLLVFGLAGFGLTDFGGSVRTAATVGDVEISTNDYARAIDARIADFQQQTGQRLTFQQAQSFGLDRQAMASLVAAAALENEANRIGISVGDEVVSREIQSNRSFQGGAGFDRTLYENALRQNGVNADDFEDNVRSNVAENLLRSAVSGGLRTADVFVDTLYNFARETRDVTWARITFDDLEVASPVATDAELAAFHTENPAAFTRPETKVIDYAWLTPDMLAENIAIDDAQLREIYDQRIAEFDQPERRLIERLVFSTDADAAAAKARLDAGDATFEDLVAERGLELADIDQGDVTVEDLGAAGDALFALIEPGVAGPLPSNLGPALYRMNGILAAQNTSFEEARAILAPEAAADRARRIIIDTVPQIEDLLAGGADAALLAERTDMQAGHIEWNVDVQDDIAAYEAFRTAAAAAQQGAFPEVIELDDGGIVTLIVSEVIAPELRPLEEVRSEVAEAVAAVAQQELVEARANELADELRSGREMARLASLGYVLEFDRDIPRAGFLEGTPPDFNETVFQLKEGEIAVLAADGDAWIARLDTITAPDGNSPDAEVLKESFSAQMSQEIGNGIAAIYAQSLVSEAGGVQQNAAAINAIGAPAQHGGF